MRRFKIPAGMKCFKIKSADGSVGGMYARNRKAAEKIVGGDLKTHGPAYLRKMFRQVVEEQKRMAKASARAAKSHKAGEAKHLVASQRI
jgi:hypothetical protein